MKRTLRYVGWTAIAIVAGTVLIRAAWVASRIEGGWQILREHLVAGLPPTLPTPQPDRLWHRAKLRLLDEADRIAADPNSTADQCMGVAWLLGGAVGGNASPDPSVVGRFIWNRAPGDPRVDEWHNVDRSLATRARQMAAKATTLQPERVDGWRLRALLMIWPENYLELELDGLQAGSEHDPTNALYDYLLAAAEMNRSFSQRETVEGPVRFVGDKELYESGRRRYENASAKQLLACGENGLAAVAPLLRTAEGPLAVKLAWNNPVLFEFATIELIRHIESPLESKNLSDLLPTELSSLTSWLTQYARWPQQIVIAPKTLWLNDYRKNSATINDSYWSRIMRIDSLLRGESKRDNVSKLLSIAGVAAAAMAIMFAALSLLSWLGLAMFRRYAAGPNRIGFLRAPLVFAISLALTFAFLGMVGAYRPELREYPWRIGCGLLALLVWLFWLASRLGRFTWRQSHLPREQRSRVFRLAQLVLVIVVSFVFVVALFSLTDDRFRAVARDFVLTLPSNILPQGGVDYVTTQALGANWYSLPRAGLEWCFRGGAFLTVGISCVWLFYVTWRRSTPNEAPRERLAKSVRYASSSALWLAMLLLLASIAVTTQSISDLAARYHRDLARLGDHAWLAKEAEAQTKRLELNASQ